MADHGFDVKQGVVTALSWSAYAAVFLRTMDLGKADNCKSMVESIGGMIKTEDSTKMDSIQKKVTGYCQEAWKTAIEQTAQAHLDEPDLTQAIRSLKSSLPDCNFAADPFHWDEFGATQRKVIRLCREKNRQVENLGRIADLAKELTRRAYELLAREMDDDYQLKSLIMAKEQGEKLDKIQDTSAQTLENTQETLQLLRHGIAFENERSVRKIPTEGRMDRDHPSWAFAGRTETIAEVLQRIDTCKIVLVHGEGGIGKTELCREVLIRMEPRLKQEGRAVLAVNLIECRDFHQLMRRIAGACRIAVAETDTAEEVEERVLEKLAERKNVLYLDNFEDVISQKRTDGQERHKVVDFLRRCRQVEGVTILISSRQMLNADLPISEIDLDVLDADSAVALFMEIWNANAGVSEEKTESVEEIRDFVVNTLYCYPLTIVLTAKKKRYVASLAELREKWKQVGVEGMENPRHASLTTALNMTFCEIQDDQSARWLWELFTLFPGAVDVDVAEHVVAEAYQARARLIDLSVIHLHGMQMNILPTLREHIRTTLQYAQDITAISQQLLEYYSGVFDVNRVIQMGSDKDQKAVACIPNALFFMNIMADDQNEGSCETLLRMHLLLGQYYLEAPQESYTLLIRMTEMSFPDVFRAGILVHCAEMEMRLDKLQVSEAHLIEAENLYRGLHSDSGLANAFLAHANLAERIGRIGEVRKYLEEAEELCRRAGEDHSLANILRARVHLEMQADQLKSAEEYCIEAEKLCRRLSDGLGVATVLQVKGALAMRRDQFDEAERCFLESEKLFDQLCDDLGRANSAFYLGELAVRRARPNEAERYYMQAKGLYDQIDDSVGQSNILRSIGELREGLDQLEEAEECFQKAEKLCREVQYTSGLARVLQGRGNLEARLGHCREAEEDFEEAEGLLRQQHSKLKLANLLICRAELEKFLKQFESVERDLREAELLYREIHDQLGMANVRRIRGEIKQYEGRLEEAQTLYAAAETEYRSAQEYIGLANVLRLQAIVEIRINQLDSARQKLYEAEKICRQTHQNRSLVYVMSAWGRLEEQTGDLLKAEQYYQETAQLCKSTQQQSEQFDALINWGRICLMLHKWTEALECSREAEKIPGITEEQLLYAASLMNQSSNEQRLMELSEEERKARAQGDDRMLAGSLLAEGDLQDMLDRPEKAVKCYREAKELYQRLGDDQGCADVLESWIELEEDYDHRNDVEKYSLELEVLYRRLHDDRRLASVLERLGDIWQGDDRIDEAEEVYAEADDLYCQIEEKDDQIRLLRSWREMESECGDLQQEIAIGLREVSVYESIGNLEKMAYTMAELSTSLARDSEAEQAKVFREKALQICATITNEKIRQKCQETIEGRRM